MAARAIVALTALSLVAAAGAADVDESPPPGEDLSRLAVKDLPPKYRTWMDDEVPYILTSRERDVFLRLKSNELRDRFIDEFWRRRDPVPVTPENEYQIEFGKRLAHVREYFKIVRQDQSRIYLLLGPPSKIYPYPSATDWWPMEVWEYENLGMPTLPSEISLLFFKPRVGSSYRLWSPTVDGMNALRTVSPVSSSMKEQLNPARYLPQPVANAVHGIAPGLGPFGSERVLLEVQKPPPVDLTGVERILTGSVTTAVSYAALPMQATVKWYFGSDPLRREVNVALEVPPEGVAYTPYQGRQFFGLFVSGQLRKDGTATPFIINEWSETVSSSMSNEERDGTTGLPFLYTYRFQLLPGRYTLNLVARDDNTQRLGLVDLPIEIPDESAWALSPPIMVDKLSPLEQASGNIYAPFVFEQVEMVPDVEQRLSTRKPAVVFVQLRHGPKQPEGLRLRYRLVKSDGGDALDVSEPLAAGRADEHGVQSVLKQLDLASVAEGRYRFQIELTSGTDAVPLARVETAVSVTASATPTGRILARSFEQADPARAANSAGVQLLTEGKLAEAREEFHVALSHDPDNRDAKTNLGRIMVLAGESAAARDAMLELTNERADPESFMVLGAAYAGLGDPKHAAGSYRRAIEMGGESPVTLNALAEALEQSGDRAGAIATARRSLELAPDQPLLRRYLESISAAGGDDR